MRCERGHQNLQMDREGGLRCTDCGAGLVLVTQEAWNDMLDKVAAYEAARLGVDPRSVEIRGKRG